MNERAMWKMFHVLYNLGSRPSLTYAELASLGVDCTPDTIEPLCRRALVEDVNGAYRLTTFGKDVADTFHVANPRWRGQPVWVDDPSAFVVMPFREPWLTLYDTMIEPAVTAARLMCVRGDRISRAGDLPQNIWNAILRAGVVVADISAENANVFYELGLAHALGKDTFVLRERNARVPADIGAAHYVDYDASAPEAGRAQLETLLRQWVDEHHPHETAATRR
jgi:hypothetical protein